MEHKVSWINIVGKLISIELYNHIIDKGVIKYNGEPYAYYYSPVVLKDGMFITILINPEMNEFKEVNVKEIEIYNPEFEAYNNELNNFLK